MLIRSHISHYFIPEVHAIEKQVCYYSKICKCLVLQLQHLSEKSVGLSSLVFSAENQTLGLVTTRQPVSH